MKAQRAPANAVPCTHDLEGSWKAQVHLSSTFDEATCSRRCFRTDVGSGLVVAPELLEGSYRSVQPNQGTPCSCSISAPTSTNEQQRLLMGAFLIVAQTCGNLRGWGRVSQRPIAGVFLESSYELEHNLKTRS